MERWGNFLCVYKKFLEKYWAVTFKVISQNLGKEIAKTNYIFEFSSKENPIPKKSHELEPEWKRYN